MTLRTRTGGGGPLARTTGVRLSVLIWRSTYGFIDYEYSNIFSVPVRVSSITLLKRD